VAPMPRKAVPSLTSDDERKEISGKWNWVAEHSMHRSSGEPGHGFKPGNGEIGKMQGEDFEPSTSPRGISRREWFKAAAGSSVGLAVSGFLDVPTVRAATQKWKLFEIAEFTTSCNFCSCGCGMVASVREGKLITMEGDFDHIVNRGSLCVKGISMFATHASPNRLATPRYRAPGSDRWEEISWENAVERIAQKIRKRVTRPGLPPRNSVTRRSRSTGLTRSHSWVAHRTPTRSAIFSRKRLVFSVPRLSNTRPDFDTAPRSPVWGLHSGGAR
jgi:hypothetical protein